jgi:hypothetical protein
LGKIVAVLGSPTAEDLLALNPSISQHFEYFPSCPKQRLPFKERKRKRNKLQIQTNFFLFNVYLDLGFWGFGFVEVANGSSDFFCGYFPRGTERNGRFIDQNAPI